MDVSLLFYWKSTCAGFITINNGVTVNTWLKKSAFNIAAFTKEAFSSDYLTIAITDDNFSIRWLFSSNFEADERISRTDKI